jgi:hypothetical protein
MKPINAVAEMILKVRQETQFYTEQIVKNQELLEQLEPLAEWAEEPVPDQTMLDQS